MNEYIREQIGDHVLEYYDETHLYLVDGIIVPSITSLLKRRFGNKYQGISQETLNRAAERGTAVHEAIEMMVKEGIDSDLPEVRNFRFLQRQYGFEVAGSEMPVILFQDDEPIAAGRFDLMLIMNGVVGGADIKRTSTLDKEYVACQLNLYRIAVRQSYGIEWDFLRAIHLRDNVRKFIEIPIDETMIQEFLVKETNDEQSDIEWQING